MRYRLVNNNNDIIYCNLLDNEKPLINEIKNESTLLRDGRVRFGVIKSKNGVSFASSSRSDYLKSSQKFKTSHKAIHNSIEFVMRSIEKQQESSFKNTGRLIHNLTSLNAHIIQEIYSLVPQQLLSDRTSGHTKIVQGIITNSSYEAALSLLAIAKASASMKTEFSVFKKLFNPDPTLQKKYHQIHKVLMNILYLFFQDFTDKSVIVKITESTATGFFDYESIHVALYHVLDNAAKYTKPNSTIEITISEDENYVSINFAMTSLRIYDYEIPRIFEEGFSGKLSTNTAKKGSGIGTFLIREVLRINNGYVDYSHVASSIHKHMGIEYQTNSFKIGLPRKHKA
ncbi:ATP-binding protein [Comamonas testosteroni]|uniref:sensor histidine kinase n=1 Tax=Comamonas testosteroni TaxID=285 RepID=UPI00265DBB40|nr:ATP-binding protein [Comamonas testosteroni]WKL16661.1 ATP-binding protein [Comamonas testosteroni]